MSLRQIFLRSTRSNLHPRHNSTLRPSNPSKSKPPTPPNSNPNTTATPPPHHAQTKINHLLSRLPKFLQPYTTALRTAPITHMSSFLILHELTAIIPLLGLVSWFHWGNGMSYLPKFITANEYIPVYIEKFGRYFRKKGWFGFRKEDGDGDGLARSVNGGGNGGDGGEVKSGDGSWKGGMGKREKIWTVGEKGSRILVEVATAYAVTKVLLPLRVVVSLWGTPWFARVVLGLFRRGRGRGRE